MIITVQKVETTQMPSNDEYVYKKMVDTLIKEIQNLDPEEIIEKRTEDGRRVYRMQIVSNTCSEYYEDEDNSTNEVLFIK